MPVERVPVERVSVKNGPISGHRVYSCANSRNGPEFVCVCELQKGHLKPMQVLLKILTLFVFAFVSACPDPCLVGGQGCNDDDDCSAKEHCILPKDADALGCYLVKGSCEPLNVCHRQSDCPAAMCCDQETWRCALEGSCTQACNLLSYDCPEGQMCDDRTSRCRPRCDVTDELACGELEMCDLGGTCSMPQGTPCGQNPDAIVADCGFYVHCISPNDDGQSYCSLRCDADNPCPLGTYCNGDDQCASL